MRAFFPLQGLGSLAGEHDVILHDEKQAQDGNIRGMKPGGHIAPGQLMQVRAKQFSLAWPAVFRRAHFVECQAAISGRQYIADMWPGKGGGGSLVAGAASGRAAVVFDFLQPVQDFTRHTLPCLIRNMLRFLAHCLALPLHEYGDDVLAVEAVRAGANTCHMRHAAAVVAQLDILFVFFSARTRANSGDTQLSPGDFRHTHRHLTLGQQGAAVRHQRRLEVVIER